MTGQLRSVACCLVGFVILRDAGVARNPVYGYLSLFSVQCLGGGMNEHDKLDVVGDVVLLWTLDGSQEVLVCDDVIVVSCGVF